MISIVKKWLNTVLAAALFAAAASSAPAQDKADPVKKPVTITEGIGVNGIKVGTTTIEEVILELGEDYELITHKSYSQEYRFRSLGLAFWVCGSDVQRQVFAIGLRPPFKGKTEKGIELGVSDFKQVEELYGKPDEYYNYGFEYKGIQFYYDKGHSASELSEKEIKNRKVVSIDIVESTGLRQCDGLDYLSNQTEDQR